MSCYVYCSIRIATLLVAHIVTRNPPCLAFNPVRAVLQALAQRLDELLPPGMAAPELFRTVARNEALFIHIADIGLLGPTGLLDRCELAAALRER